MSSFIRIGPVVLPLWVVENRPFPLLWPLAYTTACTCRDVSWDSSSSMHRRSMLLT